MRTSLTNDIIMNSSSFRRLLWIAILVSIAMVNGCNREEYTPLGKEILVPVVKDLSASDNFVPDSSITTNIRYESKSVKYGVYPILIHFTIVNTSDSVKYVEPPQAYKISNNPVFFLTDRGGNPVPENSTEVVYSDWMPPISKFYLKLYPHDSISYRVKIDDKYLLTPGQKYYFQANYFSRYVLVGDSSLKIRSYCNVSNSNILEYSSEQ